MQVQAQVERQLDQFLQGMKTDRVSDSLEQLFGFLYELKQQSGATTWNNIVATCVSHPIRNLIHQDPFTRRAYEKPRGYPGDAELLDYIYGPDERWQTPADVSELGGQIYRFTRNAPAARGVRSRARIMAQMIDQLAFHKDKPDLFAMAAGHLRESEMVGALRQKRLGRWVAMDADAESLREVDRSCGHHGVETVHGSVKSLIGKKHELGRFDLAYTTGLFDYLEAKVAARLMEEMFAMLKPGGRLVVANFLTGVRDRGYMETFMGWNLIFRSRRDMEDLAQTLGDEVRSIHTFNDEHDNIVFLDVTKR